MHILITSHSRLYRIGTVGRCKSLYRDNVMEVRAKQTQENNGSSMYTLHACITFHLSMVGTSDQ